MSEHKKAREAQYRIDHKEELGEKKKIYYQKNKERISEYQRQYRLDNAEIISLRAQRLYEKNGDAMNARTKASRRPGILHRALMKEFKKKYSPWNEGQQRGIHQIVF